MLGGFSLLIGAGMLMSLKWEMDTAPDAPQSLDMNVAFLLLLFFTGLTGLLTLLFLETRGDGNRPFDTPGLGTGTFHYTALWEVRPRNLSVPGACLEHDRSIPAD
jgi:hypothetical protein